MIPMRAIFDRRCVAVCFCLGLLPFTPLLPAADPPTLTHGPIVGRPTEHTMRIWGRTSEAAPFEVHYGTEPGRLKLRSAAVTTQSDHDNTGWVELTNLQADARYFYHVHMGDVPQGKPGSFRTLPAAESFRDPMHNPKGLFNFRFEIGCC